MVATANGQTYGRHIPLLKVRELLKERAALERDYAVKLQTLVKRAADKKAKKMATLVVGSEPTKSWEESILKTSTLDAAYSQVLSSMSDTAQDHVNLADALSGQVIEPLRLTRQRHDDNRKRQLQYYQKLLSDKERTYADRVKYDEECTEVHAYRQKQERASDDRHAERAARQYEQQQIDMLNSKNAYLISIAVSNKAKAKFYDEDIPALEDDLQARLIDSFASSLKNAQVLQLEHLDIVRSHITRAEQVLSSVNPAVDQDIFIDHNIVPFSTPEDFVFEPCATYYDTGDMSVDPAPKVYLQNRLNKCRTKLQDLDPVLTNKRQDTEKLGNLVTAYTEDATLGNADELLDQYLEAHHALTFFSTSDAILRTEVDTVSGALCGDEGGQSPHSFKSASFSIPASCSYCKSSIWGLSKQGKTCKACGISVHAKCELKLPADCSGSRHGHRSSDSVSSLSRTPSTVSPSESRSASDLGFILSTPTPSSFAPPSHGHEPDEESGPRARVVFDFTPTSPFELTVTAESIVRVLEEDDGSGWVKVADDSGGKGLVPASYVELLEPGAASSADRGATPRSGTPVPQASSGEYVRGIYAYKSQGPDELSVDEGQLIQLTDGPAGGRHYAEGWWEGIGADGRKGIFPSNYVEDA
ncbi:uncharacterized protein BXZ73DRAFT_89849 [Epithele typhae]|uniref:uncharacterized protein n=1 Tax=Epithele typhae TaxID=378194 RepID=UPI0020072823|nr:uncharacterized protein BXZ73DRAFT_89849 [Epithele typhae]KAH9933234.1 hypothetical protein BXZ73DRAFT_89849 [Epithele typhae]